MALERLLDEMGVRPAASVDWRPRETVADLRSEIDRLNEELSQTRIELEATRDELQESRRQLAAAEAYAGPKRK